MRTNQPSTQPRRAAIYCRVSSAGQEDNSSLATQEAACRAYAEERGWTVVAVHREVHTGAELFERPELTRLREGMRRGDFDVLLVHALDRLSRKQTHQGLVLSEAEHAGVVWDSATEDIDDSPQGQILRAVIGGMAEMERLKIRERTIRGKLARVNSGKLHNHGSELYGYRRDKLLGVRTIHEPEAAVVRRIYQMVATDKATMRSVIRKLNEDDVPPPSAGKLRFSEVDRKARWGQGALARILSEPAYKGETWAWRFRSVKNGGGIREEAEWIQLPSGTTPPIIEGDMWDAVQIIRAANKGAATRNEVRPYLLRGLLACKICGRVMRSTPEHGRRTYRCSSRETVHGPCGASRVNADRIEGWAWSHVEDILQSPSTIAAEIERRREGMNYSDLNMNRQAALQALQKLETQQHRLVQRLGTVDDEGGVLWELVRREVDSAERQKIELRAALQALDEQQANREATVADLDALNAYCASIKSRLTTLEFPQRRMAVEALIERIEANGKDWTLQAAIPLGADAGTLSTTC